MRPEVRKQKRKDGAWTIYANYRYRTGTKNDKGNYIYEYVKLGILERLQGVDDDTAESRRKEYHEALR